MDDTDLQAALDASVAHQQQQQQQQAAKASAQVAPAASNAGAAAGSTSASASDATAAAAPAAAFGPVSNLAEFKTATTAAVKRLGDASSDTYVELENFILLLDAVHSGVLGVEATRYALRDVLHPALNHVLGRTYAHDERDMALVGRVVRGVLNIVAQHQRNNLPAQLQPLPALTSLPLSLLKPPAPPALTLPPIVPGAAGSGGQQGATGSGSMTRDTVTIGGVPIPIARPVNDPSKPAASTPASIADAAIGAYGPQLRDAVEAAGSKPFVPASLLADEEKTVPENEKKMQETKEDPALPPPPEGHKSTAEASSDAPAATSASTASSSVDIGSTSASGNSGGMTVTVDRVADEPTASFLDIARGGAPASPFGAVPARSISPGLASPAPASNGGSAVASPSGSSGSLSVAGAAPNSAAAAASMYNRDLDQQVMDLLDLVFDDSKGFYTHYGLEAAPAPVVAAAPVQSTPEGVAEPTETAAERALREKDPTLDPQSAEMIAWRSGLKVGDWVDVAVETGPPGNIKIVWKSAKITGERNPPPVATGPPPLPAGMVAVHASVAGNDAPVKTAPGTDVSAASSSSAAATAADDASSSSTPAVTATATDDAAPSAAVTAAVIIPPPPPAEWDIKYEGLPEHKVKRVRKSEAVWRFAPLFSRTKETLEPWRMALQPGDKLDCQDYMRKWYTCRVLSTDGALVKVSFDGWGPAFDESFQRANERLAPYRSRALGGKESGGVAAPYANHKCNDVSDPEDAIAVWRGGKDSGSGASSRFLAEFATYFQREHQGFDLLIQRLVHKHGPLGASPSMGVAVIRKMVELCARLVLVFSKSFAHRIIPLIRMAVTETILTLSDIELRGLNKEHLEEIVKSLEKLLARIHAPRDTAAFLECFSLDCAYKRFRSPIVERRLNGMTYLQEYTSSIRRSAAQHHVPPMWLTAHGFVEWIHSHDILSQSFGSEGHPELMKKSAELLRFIAGEHRLQTEHLDLIWRALEAAMRKQDEPRLAIIYKVLDDIAYNLATSHLVYLFEKVRTEIALSDYTVGTLDLVKELTRFTSRSSGSGAGEGENASKHAMDLLWSISQDESGAASDIQLAARARLEDIGVAHKSFRLHYLERCVTENLARGKSVPQTILLMMKLLDSFPETVVSHSSYYTAASPLLEQEQSRHHVIMYLQEQFGLMQHLFADVARFKKHALVRAGEEGLRVPSQQGPRSVEGINSLVISSKATFLKQVQDRLQFVQYLLVNSNMGTQPAPIPAAPTTMAAPAATTAATPDPSVSASGNATVAAAAESTTTPASAVPEDSSAATAALVDPVDPAVPRTTKDEVDTEGDVEMTTEDSTAPAASSATKDASVESTKAQDPPFEVPASSLPVASAYASSSSSSSESKVAESTESKVVAPSASSSPAPSAPTALPPIPVVGLLLHQEHIDLLWEQFYTNSLSAAEREAFFRWLRNICVIRVEFQPALPTSSYSSYSPPTPPPAKSYFASPLLLSHVFALLTFHMDPLRTELGYYLCFQQAFLAFNQQLGYLRMKPQPPPANPSYSSSPAVLAAASEAASMAAVHGAFTIEVFSRLHGFEQLWELCLEAPARTPARTSNEVVQKASEFLNKIYSPDYLSEKEIEGYTPSSSGDAEKGCNSMNGGLTGIAAIRMHYINRCMDTFRRDVKMNNNNNNNNSNKSDASAGSGNHARAVRCLSLLHHLLDTSENLKGLGGLRSHGTQTRGKLLRLPINYPTTAAAAAAKKVLAAATSADAATAAAASGTAGGSVPGAGAAAAGPARMEVRVFSNDTLFDLRSLLSKELRIPLDLLKLYVSGRNLTPSLNRMHLHELRIRDGAIILVSRKQQALARVELIDKGSNEAVKPMMPLFRAAITDIFFHYAERENDQAPAVKNGFGHPYPLRTMTKQNMATYILSCGAGETSASDERISTIFVKYASPADWAYKSEELTVEGFCEFYRDACGDRPDNVWSDLKAHGYRNDLRREADVVAEEQKAALSPESKEENSRTLPRALLASNNEYFTLLFQALLEHQADESERGVAAGMLPGGEESLSALIWSLLQRLPSNQSLYDNLASLQAVKDGAVAEGKGKKNSSSSTSSAHEALRALNGTPPLAAGSSSGDTNSTTSVWDELLDSRNVYRLLYALQILESLTEPVQDEAAEGVFNGPSSTPAAHDVVAKDAPAAAGADGAATAAATAGADASLAPPAVAETLVVRVPSPAPAAPSARTAELLSQRDAWSRLFLHSGGFQHLYSILVSSHLFDGEQRAAATFKSGAQSNGNFKASSTGVSHNSVESTLRKKCVTLLLKTLYHYLLAAMTAEAPRCAGKDVGGPDSHVLGFVARILNEGADGPSASEREAEEKALEAEKNRVEAENRAASSGGASSPRVYGPFINGSGPIVNPGAPTAPALYATAPAATAAAQVEEVRAGASSGLDRLDPAGDELPPLSSRPDLLLLGRQMSSGFSSAVLQCVDFSQLLQVLWRIVTLAAEGGAPQSQAPASTAAVEQSDSTALVSYSEASGESAGSAAQSVTATAAAALEQVNTDMAEPTLNCMVNILIFDAERRQQAAAAGVSPSGPSLLAQFYELVEQGSCVSFFRILYDPASAKLRQLFASTLFHVCKRVHTPSDVSGAQRSLEHPQHYFLTLLMQHLPTHASANAAGEQGFSSADCSEYFWLLSKLIASRMAESFPVGAADGAAAGAPAASAQTLREFLPLLRSILAHLRNHESREVSVLGTASNGAAAPPERTLASPNKEASSLAPKQDNILCGLLQILSELLEKLTAFREAVGQGLDPGSVVDAAEGAAATKAVQPASDGEARGLVYELFFSFLFTQPLPAAPSVFSDSAPVLVLPPPPRCQSKASRTLAFGLLSTLCERCPRNFHQLLGFLQAQQTAIQARLKAASAASLTSSSSMGGDYNPEKLSVAPSGYVGLRNLGSTCYMNSLLQQFFMVPAFRYGILRALPSKLAALQQAGPSPALDDHLLYQLQNLFGFLSSSHKQFVDTSAFVRAYKDEFGQPINPRLQQDAQEFFNVLMDRLEFGLKSDARFDKLIASLFEGQLVNQMICHGPCGRVRESTESYMTLSLEVRGKPSLSDSLRAYVEGEVLSGIRCDACDSKANDTTKRIALGRLPQTLFLHLKRFSLSYESFTHEKINDRFEFPLEVDLEPYTKEGLARLEAEKARGTDSSVKVPEKYSLHPREYYEYALYGILIHSGSAQSGHYYSMIKERSVDGESSGGNSGGGAWLEFNDQHIRPFDITKDLDEQCYGGESTSSDTSSWGVESVSTTERIKSAYMLCYERKGQYRCSGAPNSPIAQAQAAIADAQRVAAADAAAAAASSASSASTALSSIPSDFMSHPLRSVLPARIQSQVLADNAAFMEDRFVFSAEYFAFMQKVVAQGVHIVESEGHMQVQLVKQPAEAVVGAAEAGSNGAVAPAPATVAAPAPSFSLSFIQFSTSFFLDTLLRSASQQVVSDYLSSLCALFKVHPPAAAWFLDFVSSGGDRAESLKPLAERKLPSPALIIDVLLAQREAHVRKAFASLLCACISILAPAEMGAGLWQAPDETHSSESMLQRSPIQRYILLHASLLSEAAPKNWVRFHEYLTLFESVCQILGVVGRRFLIRHGVLASLTDLYLQDASPLALAEKAAGRKSKRHSMGNMVTQPSFGPLLHTVSLLARTCFLPYTFRQTDSGAVQVDLPIPPTLLQDSLIVLAPPAQQPQQAQPGAAEGASSAPGASEADAAAPGEPQPPSSNGDVSVAAAAVPSSDPNAHIPLYTAQPFNESDYKLLTCPALYGTAFQSLADVDHLIPLAIHMCYEHGPLSQELVAVIINGIQKSDAGSVKPFFDLMAATVAIADSLQQARFDKLLAPSTGVLHMLHAYRNHSSRFTYVSIKFLVRIMSETPAFAKKMMEVRQAAWMWIDRWLREYVDKPTGPAVANHASSSDSATPASKVQEARMATFAQYQLLVESLGGAMNLEPPPMLMIGDSSGNASASAVASSSGVGSLPDNSGEECLPPLSDMGREPSPLPADLVVVGVKVDEKYMLTAAQRAQAAAGRSAAAGDSDDEFEQAPGGASSSSSAHRGPPQTLPTSLLSEHRAATAAERMAKTRAALQIAVNSGAVPQLDLTTLDEGVPGGAGGAAADDGDEGREADEKSSSYKGRSNNSPKEQAEQACPVCTYLNPAHRVTCEMCGGPLKSGGDDDMD